MAARLPRRVTPGAVLEGIAEAVLVIDHRRRVRLANEAAGRLLDAIVTERSGRPALAAVLRRCARLDDAASARLLRLLGGAMEGGEAEGRIRLRDGTPVLVSIARIAVRAWRLSLRPATRAEAARPRRDPLTGLADRAWLRARLAAAMRRGRPVLLMLDLDRFKPVNDTLGHLVGDRLLRAVADRMRAAVRGRDLVARLGGDEFAILLADGDFAGADGLAARLTDLVGRPYLLGSHLATVGVSIGLARAEPGCEDPDEVVRQADLALYQAKAEGRGTWRLFEPAMDERAQDRRRLEAELRAALPLGEFTLHYQPQYALESRRLVGFEALLRWTSRTRGPISPAVFIPVAEEIGLARLALGCSGAPAPRRRAGRSRWRWR